MIDQIITVEGGLLSRTLDGEPLKRLEGLPKIRV